MPKLTLDKRLQKVLMHSHVSGDVTDIGSLYLKRDGTTTLTGNWDAGSFEIRAETLRSDVITGTPPLTVASTTKVTNLNADQVDSLDAQTLTATSPITLSGTTSVLATAGITIAHATTDGNIHLPSGGTVNQILKNSGTAGTGAWGTVTENAGALGSITTINMNNQLTNTLADGTAPFVITSTTKSSNLNADLTDGVHIDALTTTRLLRYNSTGTKIESSSVTETSGALGGITTLSMNNQLTNTLAIGTAPFVVTSTTKVDNLYVDRAALSDTVTTNANLSGDVSSVGNTTTIGNGKVTEAMQVLADNTTNDVSTSKHGYAPRAVAPAANVLNVFGIANGETAVTNKSIFDATNPTTIGIGDAASPGTSLIAAHRDHQHASPSTFTATAHNILSAIHGDTLTDSVLAGDVLVGNATPKWSRLAANSTATKKYLQSVSSGVPSWEQVAYADVSGTPTLPQNEAGAANNFLTAYNSSTGAFSKAQPTWANIDKTISSIADITTRSHTALTDIGTNTHPQIDTAIGQLTTQPTELKLSTASKGGVFNGGFESQPTFVAATTTGGRWIDGTAAGSTTNSTFGWYLRVIAGACAAQFDATISHLGKGSLKLSHTNTSGRCRVNIRASSDDSTVTLPQAANLIQIKPSTTYRMSGWVKTNNAAVGSAFIEKYEFAAAGGSNVFGTQAQTSKLSGTTDWTYLNLVFTSAATAAFIQISCLLDATGNVSDAWFDDIKLEEIVTDTTFTGKTAEKVRPVFQAATSTNNVDQSLDTGGAYANTYALTNAVNEGATHIQTFTPTKKYITQIAVWPIDKGTGNWTLIVHDATNNILASQTIANASITNGAMNYFDVPNIWTTGNLHFHVYSSVADGTLKANTSNDLETCSYIQRYAKKSENFSLITNGVKTELRADKDGMLSNAIIDMDNSKYRYTNPFSAASNFNDIYSATAGGGTTIPDVISGWDWTNTAESIASASDATARNLIFKFITILPIKHLKIKPTLFNNNVALGTLSISLDNSTYTTLWTLTASAAAQTQVIETDLCDGVTIFYIKVAKDTTNGYIRLDDLVVEADIDTSEIPIGSFYPLNTNQFTETVYLPSNAATVAFRKSKFINEYGIVIPTLEFSSSATAAAGSELGYVPLPIDNSQETNPAVRLLSTTTNYQESGTGSASSGYILNDGEYMTLTSAEDQIKVDYQVGGGTTSFANITKNVLYYSSNGDSNDSTQDPSLQFNIELGLRNQGVLQRLSDIGNDLEKTRQLREFGSMFIYNLTAGAAVTVSATDTWYQIGSGFTQGLTEDMYFENARELRIKESGLYLLTWNLSLECANANQEVEGTIMKNAVADTKYASHFELVNPNRALAMSGSGFLSTKAGDLISLAVLNHTATNNIVVDHARLVMLKIR